MDIFVIATLVGDDSKEKQLYQLKLTFDDYSTLDQILIQLSAKIKIMQNSTYKVTHIRKFEETLGKFCDILETWEHTYIENKVQYEVVFELDTVFNVSLLFLFIFLLSILILKATIENLDDVVSEHRDSTSVLKQIQDNGFSTIPDERLSLIQNVDSPLLKVLL